MDITEYTISNKTISWMFVLLLIGGGIVSFFELGRLEDPAFAIKQAMIITSYPGASALEVEEEVTLPLEDALQHLPYIDNITSTSGGGTSQILVEMKSIYRKNELAQIWDEMRRKIHDMQDRLPPGVQAPQIIDDFGDVYGLFLAITGEGYSYEDIKDYSDYIRRELALVPGVGKVIISGQRQEQIFIEINRAKLAASSFSISELQNLLSTHNLVSNAGKIKIGSEYIRISSKTSSDAKLTSLGNLLVGRIDGQLVYLQDIAKITRAYSDPPQHIYRFNGQPALTLGVSFASDVNVVEVGEAILKRRNELEYQRPVGMQIDTIYDQPSQVNASVKDFLISLAQAMAIVIVVLLFTMGFRPGIIMCGVLLLTILGTFIIMNIYNIELHRISLGALIIALGMLVDNAIVITEGIMIGIKRGVSRLEAAKNIVRNTKWPLLGATIIAITAFAPIGLSPDASGEFTGSLFWVLLISLLLSWVFAISLTPFFCYLMFRETKNSEAKSTVNPYSGTAYKIYRSLLNFTLRFRWPTISVMVIALIVAVYGFGSVKQAFFPASSLPMFIVDYWLPEGSSIDSVNKDIEQLEQEILALPSVETITATIGRGAERFILTYTPETSNSSYAQLIIKVSSFNDLKEIRAKVKNILQQGYPQAFIRFQKFELGPSTKAKIEARIIGSDPQVLRSLSQDVIAIFDAEPDALNVHQDWRERSKIIQPVYDAAEGRRLGISKADMNSAFAFFANGQKVGLFRNGSNMLPIIMRPPKSERTDVSQMDNLLVYSPVKQTYVNIGQIMTHMETGWEDPVIKRRDRKRTLAVLADPVEGVTSATLHAKIKNKVEQIQLPIGYNLEWGGEYEAQKKANIAVFTFIPLGVLIMVILTVLLFKSVKQTLVVWLTVPLAIIGVTIGLLITNSPFSFMALLAVLSLIGMQLKNGIVLVEEIKRLKEQEHDDWLCAITNAAVSRLRPVTVAAITTILGMLPLLSDVFFQPLAVTIMFGLGFATLLTLLVVPVLFALFYGVRFNN